MSHTLIGIRRFSAQCPESDAVLLAGYQAQMHHITTVNLQLKREITHAHNGPVAPLGLVIPYANKAHSQDDFVTKACTFLIAFSADTPVMILGVHHSQPRVKAGPL